MSSAHIHHEEHPDLTQDLHASSTLTVDPRAVRRQLARILADDLFKKSKRYSDLLRHLVDQSLKGQLEELRERAIGHKVFGKSRFYDVSTDPTVRVVATEVRKRLALFYNSTGQDSEILIDIPAGAYAAEFHVRTLSQTALPCEPAVGAAPPQQELHQEAPLPPETFAAPELPRPRANFRWRLLASAAGGLLLLALLGLALSRATFHPKVIDQFWSAMNGRPVLISIGLPPPEQMATSSSSVTGNAASGEAESGLTGFKGCCNNVSMLDVNVGQSFAAFLRQRHIDSTIRPADGTRFADFTAGPVVLIGLHNEWLMRLGATLPFRFRQEDLSSLQWIEEADQPASRRWVHDPQAPINQIDWDYAIVSRILDPASGNWWVSVAGFTGAGTVRAQEFLVDENQMQLLATQLPSNWKQKNLQIVLVLKVVKGSPGNAQVLTLRSW